MIPKDSGRKENWYIRFITLCMSNFNIPDEDIVVDDSLEKAKNDDRIELEESDLSEEDSLLNEDHNSDQKEKLQPHDQERGSLNTQDDELKDTGSQEKDILDDLKITKEDQVEDEFEDMEVIKEKDNYIKVK